MTAMLTERAQSFGHLFVDRVDKTPKGEAYRYPFALRLIK